MEGSREVALRKPFVELTVTTPKDERDRGRFFFKPVISPKDSTELPASLREGLIRLDAGNEEKACAEAEKYGDGELFFSLGKIPRRTSLPCPV